MVPSLGQVKVIHRRLAAAAGPGEGAPPFPHLAARWAASHKGKAFTDQARGWWGWRGVGVWWLEAGRENWPAKSTRPPLHCPRPAQVVYERLSREQALTLLRQHLTANLVRRAGGQGRGVDA